MSLKKPINENYSAVVVEIKNIIFLEKLDKICHTNIFGNLVIVGKDTKVGDIGLFFPPETELSKEFLSNNNLYRHPELNIDQTKKGYFEDSGRIRTVKFRGYPSQGFFIPLNSLNFTNHIEKLEIGDSFDKINGIPICQKYVVFQRNAGQQTNRQAKKQIYRIVDKQWNFMPDTGQLGKNLHKVKPDDLIQISYKIHGCLQYNSIITMGDGSKKKIKDVKIGDMVLGHDIKTNQIVKTWVINKAVNGRTDEWLNIETNYLKSFLKCTYDHKLYTKRGYIRAIDLRQDDEILIYRYGLKLNEIQKSVLIGKALGDGHLRSNSSFLSLFLSHKLEHKEYLEYCNYLLGNLNHDSYNEWVSGYGSKMIRSYSKFDCSINYVLRNYLDGKKFKVTEQLIEDINPLIMAIWYMDDGSLQHHSSQRDRATMAICRYSDIDIKIFKECLIKLGFNNFTFFKSQNIKGGKNYWRLRFNNSDAEKLFEMICQYVPPIMQYKLPKHHQGFFKKVNNSFLEELIPYPFWFGIKNIKKYNPSKKLKYDIETQTHNFFSNNILVHNSSMIASKILCKRKLKGFEKILKFCKVRIKDFEYDNIWSSRRVIKNPFFLNKEELRHFYYVDIWGLSNNKIKDLIPNGMSVYGEIAGYTPNNWGIQSMNGKVYDYGCEPGQFELFIYRITYTNIDGQVFEFSSKQVQEWAKNNGLKAVPELYYGYARDLFKELYFKYNNLVNMPIPEWNSDLFLELLKQEYLEKDCFMCKNASLPSEGIVLRIEQNNYEAYKLKSFRFLENETKELDKGSIDMETSQ